MKASRRHELKENDLAHALHSAQDYLREHGTKVGIGIFVVLAGLIAVGIAVQTRADKLEQAWMAKNQLTFEDPAKGLESIEKLAELTTETPDQTLALAGLFEWGMQALRLAQEVPAPPDPVLNGKAREAFEALLERFGSNALAFGTAHAGLATVEENEFAIDVDLSHKERAERHLRALLDSPLLNGLPYQGVASERLDKLDAVFTIVRFAVPVAAEGADEADATGEVIHIAPTPVPIEEVPDAYKDKPADTDESEGPHDTP